MSKLDVLVKDAVEELREWALDNPGEEPHDAISEITDSSVPVYTYDILQCAVDNMSLATNESELGPAFDGSPTPTNIIAANIYEYIHQELWDAWNVYEDEWLEELEEENEDE